MQEAKPAEAPKGLSEDEIKAMIREKVKPLPGEPAARLRAPWLAQPSSLGRGSSSLAAFPCQGAFLGLYSH